MSNYNYEKKSGHPVLGIVLAILGVLIALFFALFAGIAGGAVAGVLGLIAVLLGISARGGKGITSIVLGAIAIILAVSLTIGSVALLNKARETAASNPETPLLAKYLDNPNMGLIGIVLNIAKDGGDTTNLDALKKELDIVNSGISGTAPAATEAPAAQPEAEPAG